MAMYKCSKCHEWHSDVNMGCYEGPNGEDICPDCKAGELQETIDRLEPRWKERLRNAVDANCSCGGAGPGEGCAACEIWHEMIRDEEQG